MELKLQINFYNKHKLFSNLKYRNLNNNHKITCNKDRKVIIINPNTNKMVPETTINK